MENIIIIATVVIIVALISLYLLKAKKKGQKCIGCPYSKDCPSANKPNPCGCSQNDIK